jgi:prepilin signal peptidase PulO-like enzyme (type II secretory pathway)
VDGLPQLAAGLAGAVAGFWFPAVQHRLYREPAFRADPAGGGRLFALRAFTMPAGALVAALAFRPGSPGGLQQFLTAGFCLLLVAVSSTDFDRRRIPNVLVYPGILAALAAAPLWQDRSTWDVLLGGAAGLAAAALLLLLGGLAGAAARSRETAFGVGDAKLILLIGLLTGWPAVMTALLIGILLAGVVAAVLILLRGRGATYSYGPYLAAGAVIVLLWFDRFG